MYFEFTTLAVRHEIVDLIETQMIDEDTREFALSFLMDRNDELFAFPTLEDEADGLAWALAYVAILEPNEFPEQDSSRKIAILDALGQAFVLCQAKRALWSYKRAPNR